MFDTRSSPVNTRLVLIIACGGRPVGYRVLNLTDPSAYPSLTKQLGYRCVATHPERAGEPYEVHLVELPAAAGHPVRIRVEGWSRTPLPQLLGALDVPLENFAWLGAAVAKTLELEERFTVHVAVAAADHPLVQQWNDGEEEDFALEQYPDQLHLPSEFSLQPLGARRVMRNHGTWTCCVLGADVYGRFVQAAAEAGADSHERGWLGQVRVHLGEGRLYVVVEDLVEAPAAQSGRHFLRTSGRQFFGLYQAYPRLGAYLHLHPRDADGVELGPFPSGPDTTLARNLDACVPYPVVLPIAMFGLQPQREEQDLAVSAFCEGQLTAVDWEVLVDGAKS